MQESYTAASDFRYRTAFLKGRPRHEALDAFSRRHPPMEPWRRAKIFAPFDALRGFSEAVVSKEIRYEPFRELDEDRADMLSRRLAILQPLVCNSREARKNQVRIAVTCFFPCDEAGLGQYRTQEGILKRIDLIRRQMLVDDYPIYLDDVYDLQDPEGRLFSDDDFRQDLDEWG